MSAAARSPDRDRDLGPSTGAAQAAVLARRRRIAGLVRAGKRLGYGLFLVAIALFGVGMAAGFTAATTTAIVACLLLGSVVLAPAIVFGYAVRAAERDDREHGRPTA